MAPRGSTRRRGGGRPDREPGLGGGLARRSTWQRRKAGETQAWRPRPGPFGRGSTRQRQRQARAGLGRRPGAHPDLQEHPHVTPIWDSSPFRLVGRRMRVGRGMPYASGRQAASARVQAGSDEAVSLFSGQTAAGGPACSQGASRRPAFPWSDGGWGASEGRLEGSHPTPDMLRGPVPSGNRAALASTCAPLSSRPLRAG